MRVKALFLVSLFLLTIISSVARAELKQNFLLGGELGQESRHTHFSTEYAFPAAPGVLSHNSTRIVDAGTFMGLLAGWQVQCQRWLAGVEANVDFHSFEKHKPFFVSDNAGPADGNVSYKRGTTVGAYVRGGHWFTPFFLGYVKVGAQYSRDELTFTVTDPAFSVGGPGRALLNNAKKDIWGWVTGVGLEFPAFASSSVRVEYNFVHTNRFNSHNGIEHMKVKHTESHIGKIAWVWNFM